MIQKAGVIIRLMDASTGRMVKAEVVRNLNAGEAFTYRPEDSFSTDGQVYVWDSVNPGQSLEIAALDASIQKNVISVYYTKQDLPKEERPGEEQTKGEASEQKLPKEEAPGEKEVKTGRVSLNKPQNPAGRKVKLSWKKVSGADGYQVVYADNKQFKKAVKKTAVKNKIMLKKLKKDSTCYVKVRAYRLGAAGHRVYGKYSKTRRVVIG